MHESTHHTPPTHCIQYPAFDIYYLSLGERFLNQHCNHLPEYHPTFCRQPDLSPIKHLAFCHQPYCPERTPACHLHHNMPGTHYQRY